MNEKIISCYPVSRETELMLRLALRQPALTVPEDIDWDRFRETMKKHRIYPLVIRGLKRLPRETLERYPVLKEYSGRQNYYVNGSLKRMQTLAAVARAFEQAQIPVLSMKGPLLSMELYGDPSMRHSRDLDILVDAEDFLRAGECMKSIGFAPVENPHLKTPRRVKAHLRYTTSNHGEFEKGDMCVELHWRSSTQTKASFADLWKNRETKLLLGVPVCEMGMADKLPHLIAHAANHGYARLRWLMDLFEFQRKPQFSWTELLEDMRAQQNSELLLETLIVLNRWQVLPIEETVIGSLSVKREGDRVRIRWGGDMAAEVERAIELSEAAYPLMERELDWTCPEVAAYQKLLPNTAVRQGFLTRLMAKLQPNAADFELIDLPDRWFWLYYLIRPVYLLWRTLTGGKK